MFENYNDVRQLFALVCTFVAFVHYASECVQIMLSPDDYLLLSKVYYFCGFFFTVGGVVAIRKKLLPVLLFFNTLFLGIVSIGFWRSFDRIYTKQESLLSESFQKCQECISDARDRCPRNCTDYATSVVRYIVWTEVIFNFFLLTFVVSNLVFAYFLKWPALPPYWDDDFPKPEDEEMYDLPMYTPTPENGLAVDPASEFQANPQPRLEREAAEEIVAQPRPPAASYQVGFVVNRTQAGQI